MYVYFLEIKKVQFNALITRFVRQKSCYMSKMIYIKVKLFHISKDVSKKIEIILLVNFSLFLFIF